MSRSPCANKPSHSANRASGNAATIVIAERHPQQRRLVAEREPQQEPHRRRPGNVAETGRRHRRRDARRLGVDRVIGAAAAVAAILVERPSRPPSMSSSSPSANRAACRSNIVLYRPPTAINSSWLPSSTTSPCSITTMRSACRTVEKRCEIRMVVHPRVASIRRSKISASPRTSSCAVGSSSTTTPAPSSHPNAERGPARHAATDHPTDRCHPRGPSTVVGRVPQVLGPATARASLTGSHRERRVPPALAPGTRLSRKGNSSRTKSWNTTASLARQASTSKLRMSMPSTSTAPARRVVQTAEQFDQCRLADTVASDDRYRGCRRES